MSLVVLLALLLSACGGGGDAPGYALDLAAPEPTEALPPVRLPEDDAPHDVLTEWWYYTGHLESGDRRYGFELVTFQVRRGQTPPTYIAHYAITDISRKLFTYDQKLVTRSQPQLGEGFSLDVGGWRMAGAGGNDRLQAAMEDYAMDLRLTATKPAVLHEGDGIIGFGPAGDSYYYSRTRMDVRGTLADRGEELTVTGQAWMDHQWGNFISTLSGGWDWYSIQLEDATELMIFLIRSDTGTILLAHGTYVEPDGRTVELAADQFTIEATAEWRSPHTGAVYPSAWEIAVPVRDLELTLLPVLADQELDTRETTGVVYWEGAVEVAGTRAGRPMKGVGYVELTGYASTAPSP